MCINSGSLQNCAKTRYFFFLLWKPNFFALGTILQSWLLSGDQVTPG